MKLKDWKVILPLLAFVLIFFSCAQKRDELTIGSSSNPVVLAFSAPYARNVTGAEMEEVASAISARTLLEVKTKSFSSSVEIINEIGYKTVDVAFVTLDEYLVSREEYKAKPVLRVLRKNELKEYRGVVVTFDGRTNSLKDLEGKKVAMNNPYSVSGFILPSILFKEKGVRVEPVFTGSHEMSLSKLKKGEVSAAAFYEAMTEKEKKLVIIAHTRTVPNEPVVCRVALKKEICESITSAIEEVAKDKKIKNILGKMADITGFEKVEPFVYKGIHELILESGKSIYDVIPEGREIKKINEGYFID